MARDPGDVDFYTPEEKREMERKTYASKSPLSAWDSLKDGVALIVGGTLMVGVWIATILVILLIGAAVIKWAVEELAK